MVKPAVESMVKCLADAIEVRRELPEFREEPSEISFREAALAFQIPVVSMGSPERAHLFQAVSRELSDRKIAKWQQDLPPELRERIVQRNAFVSSPEKPQLGPRPKRATGKDQAHSRSISPPDWINGYYGNKDDPRNEK